ncbi:MAG TPA: serine/threonine-protein kinase, partial [Anaeromyxobacteraceae bacterium]|nr:serine/threonine-protein kinase [Anaeromyxobacteraceae bacterium]
MPPDPDESSPGGDLALAPGQITRLLADLSRTRDAATVPSPRVGDRLGRFLLVREIGRGGFGLVYEAEDTELRRRVALKVLRPGRGGTSAPAEWMRREAEAAAQIRHPAVVTLHDAGAWEGGTYLVYELLAGETLAARLAAGELPGIEARRILRDVARALAHVHAAGVVHRDLKPENVFLEHDGTVKLLDLGLAQVAGAAGVAAGSPPYGAPEQWRGEPVDARADVHAWGVLAHRVLTGRLPGESREEEAARRGSLRSLAEAARAADPSTRPADGAALVAAMDGMARRSRTRRNLGLAVLGVAVVAGTFALSRVLGPPPAPPPGPFRLAVADAENATGEAAFDGLGDLVARGLQGSSRIQLIDRPRLEGILRASGRVAPERMDRGVTGFAARQAGASAVLVPSATRDGGEYVLGVEALEPETGKRLFSVLERAGEEDDRLAAVERLVARSRTALRDREGDVREPGREVSRVVSSSLEAHQRYFEGLRCVDRPSEVGAWRPEECVRHFEAALAVDPDFPLAHFELVRIAFWKANPTEDLQSILDRALARVDRLPAREQAQLRAWKAQLDGRPEDGAAILAQASRDYPEDARLALALGELHFRGGRYAEAVGPLSRAVELDPGLEMAASNLVWSLGILDRTDDLRLLADRLSRASPTTGSLVNEARARAWAGEFDAAVAVARRAAPGGAGPGREVLEDVLVAAGRWDEAEEMLWDDARTDGRRTAAERTDAARPESARSESVRSQSVRSESARPLGRLAMLLRLRGRVAESEELLGRLPPPSDARTRFVRDARRSILLAGSRDAAGIGRIARETAAWSPAMAATLAVLLAYAGDANGAALLAPALDEGAGARLVLEAVLAWRRDGPSSASPVLRRLAVGDPVAVTAVLPPEGPRWLAADCTADAGQADAALAETRRFQRFFFPLGVMRSWAYPRSLLLEARLLADLGQSGEARQALSRLDALWASADPGLPL